MTEFTASLPRKRMGAGLLITDPTGRVLLVEPTYKNYWKIPGGAVGAEESPRATTIREIREELGLAVSPAGCWSTAARTPAGTSTIRCRPRYCTAGPRATSNKPSNASPRCSDDE